MPGSRGKAFQSVLAAFPTPSIQRITASLPVLTGTASWTKPSATAQAALLACVPQLAATGIFTSLGLVIGALNLLAQ
jgi:hypothetical protein